MVLVMILLSTNRTKASRLYSELVQGVKKELALTNNHNGNNNNGASLGIKKDKIDKNKSSNAFSLYTTALTPFLAAAEDVGRKRLDALFQLSHVEVKISCQSLLRHGHALFTRKVGT